MTSGASAALPSPSSSETRVARGQVGGRLRRRARHRRARPSATAIAASPRARPGAGPSPGSSGVKRVARGQVGGVARGQVGGRQRESRRRPTGGDLPPAIRAEWGRRDPSPEPANAREPRAAGSRGGSPLPGFPACRKHCWPRRLQGRRGQLFQKVDRHPAVGASSRRLPGRHLRSATPDRGAFGGPLTGAGAAHSTVDARAPHPPGFKR